ncbi:hypothetical protein V8E55_011157 [Tylopilus felleus]
MAVERLLGTTAQRAFIFTKAVVVIAMVASTFGIVHAHLGDIFDESSYKTLSCYLALYVLAELFELGMAYDALRLRNIIQLLGIILFHGALIVFSALQVHETKVALVPCALSQCDNDSEWLWRKVEPFLIVAPCIVAASWLFLIFWIKKLYEEFGWVIFHVVGANPKLKTMYQFYQIFICLLKFDFFCFVGVTMQLLIVVLATDSAEFGVSITAIPVVLILIAGCAYAVQREIKWMMSIALVLMVPCMSYFYKLVRFYLPSSQQEYITTRATLTVFTIFSFLLLLTTFLVGLKCFYDFDKGLHDSKTHDINAGQQYSSPMTPGQMGERQSSYMGGTPLQPQISIE